MNARWQNGMPSTYAINPCRVSFCLISLIAARAYSTWCSITALERPRLFVWSPYLSAVGVPLKARAITLATPYSHSTSKMPHPGDFSRAYDGLVISESP